MGPMRMFFYVNDVLMFEADGALTMTQEMFRLAGFKGNFQQIGFRVRSETEAECRLYWNLGALEEDEEIDLDNDKPIMAIKKVRERLGIGLKEAKDVVDIRRYERGDITLYRLSDTAQMQVKGKKS